MALIGDDCTGTDGDGGLGTFLIGVSTNIFDTTTVFIGFVEMVGKGRDPAGGGPSSWMFVGRGKILARDEPPGVLGAE